MTYILRTLHNPASSPLCTECRSCRWLVFIYDTTFEVPVADGLHAVVGVPADAQRLSHAHQSRYQCQCAPLVGDFDSNGTVGTSDLMQLLTAIGSFNSAYDLDGDGAVATADLMVFLATYGQSSDC